MKLYLETQTNIYNLDVLLLPLKRTEKPKKARKTFKVA